MFPLLTHFMIEVGRQSDGTMQNLENQLALLCLRHSQKMRYTGMPIIQTTLNILDQMAIFVQSTMPSITTRLRNIVVAKKGFSNLT